MMRTIRMSEQKQRIIQLTAENIKRLRAVSISLSDGVTVIGGRNAQGKSSLLDALMFLLMGKRHPDPKLLREGEEKGFVQAETEDFIIKRTITEAGNVNLTIKAKDNKGSFNSPQAVIDSMTSRACFDPLEFARMKPVDQLEQLRKLVGIDTDKYDLEAKRIYDQRTEVNREFKSLEAEVAGASVDESATKFIDPAAVEDKLKSIKETQQAVFNAKGEASAEWHTLQGFENTKRTLQKRVDSLEKELTELKSQLANVEEKVESQTAVFEAAKYQAQEIEQEIPDQLQLFAELKSIANHNENVQRTRYYREKILMRDEKRRESEEMTRSIDRLMIEKKKAIEQAEMPIEGLSFDRSGVLFNGHPFEQSSGAERLKASVAISAAMNPQMPVMIVRDGSLLDRDNMAILIEFAKEKGLQILVERVEKDEFVTIVIEDGTVQESPDAGNSPSSQRTLSI